jgi:TolB protein
MRTGLLLTLFIVAITCIAAGAAAQEERLVIRKGVITKALIAVPDLTEDGRIANSPLSTELSKALRFDLENCGYYKTIADAPGVAAAQGRDVEGGTVFLSNWRALGAELVFKADLRRTGSNLIVGCAAFELETGKRVLSRQVKGDERDARRLVHYLSNAIVKALIGVEGIATTRIAFIKDNAEGGGKDLYMVDYDGYDLKRVTRDAMVAVSPDWSPDGRQIYYTSTHKGEPYLYCIDLRKQQRVSVAAFPGLNYAVAVSPNGKKLALVLSKSGTPDIYTMDADGANLVRLTRTIGNLSTCPVWSPDGRRIAYVSSAAGGPQLYVMQADGSGQRQLLKGYRQMSSLDWSPAARTADRIVFSALEGGRYQLFAADLGDNVVKQLTFDAANHQDPNFAPDGRHIVYVREASYGAADLYILDVFDPTPVQITSFSGNEFYPVWSPTGY